MLQYAYLSKSRTTLLPYIYDGFSADWLRWECRSLWQLRCFVYDKKKLVRLKQFHVLEILQIMVSHILHDVWLLKSPTTLLPVIYDGFSPDWLSWECRSHWLLRCLACDKKKLAGLNQFHSLVILAIVFRHVLQYVWLIKSPTISLQDIFVGLSAGWLWWDFRSHNQLCCLEYGKKKLAGLN